MVFFGGGGINSDYLYDTIAFLVGIWLVQIACMKLHVQFSILFVLWHKLACAFIGICMSLKFIKKQQLWFVLNSKVFSALTLHFMS